MNAAGRKSASAPRRCSDGHLLSVGSLADASGFNEKATANFLTNMNKALCFGIMGNVQVDCNSERFINEYYIAGNPLAFGGAIQARIGAGT